MDWFGRGHRAAQKAAAEVERGVILGATGQHERALSVFDDVVRQHAEASHPKLRAEVASALYNKSVTLDLMQRGHAAMETCREVGQRFGDDRDPEVAYSVVRALFNLATGLGQARQYAQAGPLCEDVAKRCAAQNDQRFIAIGRDALANLCVFLEESGQSARALDAAQRLLNELGESKGPESTVHRINALGIMGGALAELERYEEAIAALDGALECLARYEGPDLVERRVSLLNNKGIALIRLRRYSEATATFGRAFEAALERPEPDTLVFGARAQLNKGLALSLASQPDAALEAFEAVIGAVAGKPDPRLSEVVGRAYGGMLTTLRQQGREEEARAVEARAHQLGAQLRDADDQQIAARALFQHASEQPRVDDRIELLNAGVAALAKHPGSGADAEQSAQALLNKGLELARQGRNAEAITSWNEAIALLGTRQDEAAAGVLATTLLSRALALGKLNCCDQAIAGLQEVIARFGAYRGETSAAIISAQDHLRRLQQWLAQFRSSYPEPITLSETIAGLAQFKGATDAASAPKVIPHFLNAQLAPNTLAAHLSYAAHDRNEQSAGKTGFALVASFVKRVSMETGRVPSALVVESRSTLGHPAFPDANFQLMTESLALFGLPMEVAAQHTHLGMCCAELGYPLRDVGSVTGIALVWNFERSERPT